MYGKFFRLVIALLAFGVVGKPSAAVLFDNGDPTFNLGYTINQGFSVADSFTLSSSSTVSSVVFNGLPGSGATFVAVDWRVTTQALGGEILYSGVAAPLTTLAALQAGYVKLAFSVGDIALGPGTYWLQLLNAQLSTDALGFWAATTGDNLALQGLEGVGTMVRDPVSFQIVGDASAVPELPGLALLPLGLGVLVISRRRRP